jgi:hypothetical protein
MSHLDSGLGIITEDGLDCLRAVVAKDPKLEWCEGATTYQWYGKWMQDYSGERAALNRGIDPSQYGKCSHKIKLKGCHYEIGVTKRNDGLGYSLVWDKWASGHKISAHLGADAEKLMIPYALEYAQHYAAQTGAMLNTTTAEDGSIYVELLTV